MTIKDLKEIVDAINTIFKFKNCEDEMPPSDLGTKLQKKRSNRQECWNILSCEYENTEKQEITHLRCKLHYFGITILGEVGDILEEF